MVLCYRARYRPVDLSLRSFSDSGRNVSAPFSGFFVNEQSEFTMIEKLVALRQKLSNVAFSLTRDYNRADDCVQDTILRVLEHENPIDNVEAFAMTTLRRVIVDSFRVKAIRKESPIVDGFEPAQTDRNERAVIYEIASEGFADLPLEGRDRQIVNWLISGAPAYEVKQIFEMTDDTYNRTISRIREKCSKARAITVE